MSNVLSVLCARAAVGSLVGQDQSFATHFAAKKRKILDVDAAVSNSSNSSNSVSSEHMVTRSKVPASCRSEGLATTICRCQTPGWIPGSVASFI